ncbi:type IV pilin protein, partial [Aeromonas caviae]|uniref:type IV pilin protein n=1 Tax=Aeromonas caviae TaxID=648 RepID=UPI001F2206AB
WLASIMVMASCVAVLFGDKIRSQSKPFLYLFQLVAAKDPVHDTLIATAKGSQSNDSSCTTLTLNKADTKTPSDCWK